MQPAALAVILLASLSTASLLAFRSRLLRRLAVTGCGDGGRMPAGYPFCAVLLLDPRSDGDAARLEQALNRLDGVRARVEPGGRRAVVYTRRPPDRRLLTHAAEDARYRVARYTRTA
mgnify:FL=1